MFIHLTLTLSSLPPLSFPVAMVEDTNCRFELGGMEGWVNSSMIEPEKIETNREYNMPLDCMWVVQVEPGWKVNLHF